MKKMSKKKKGVLLEDLDSKLDLLLEGQSGLTVRVDRIETRLDNFENNVDQKFKEVDYKFETVFEELHIIRNNQVNRDEFVLLEKRVMAIEKKLTHKK